MAARGRDHLDGRSIHARTVVRHGAPAGIGLSADRHLQSLRRPEPLEDKVAIQAAELDRIADENRKLVDAHVALRQELGDSQEEVQRVKAHIKSIQTESDIQIRVLLEKVARMEFNIKAGDNIKKDLQQALGEAQSLVKGRQELSSQLQQAAQELKKTCEDVEKLPELHAELDGLRKEHMKLRAMFHYEKGLNMEQVDELQAMEQRLIVMAKEVERLRSEVSNAEKRAQAPNPYSAEYTDSVPRYSTLYQYADGYGAGMPLMHMRVTQPMAGIISYENGNIPATNAAWEGRSVPGTGLGGTNGSSIAQS